MSSKTVAPAIASGSVDACTTSGSVWRYIIGFFVGVFATLTLTILIGWLIDTSTPHSSWLNRAFYGYMIGCASIAVTPDVNKG